MKSPISVVIIALNEAANISQCVTKAALISDDIIVVDSGSTDATVTLAEAAGAKVHQMQWQGYSSTKNEANTLTRHDWILSLDADEILSEELIASIQECTLEEKTVYLLSRLNNYCGHWIRHSNWYPDYVYRLFDRRFCRWQGEFVHEKLNFPADFNLIKLKGDLLHYTYRTAEEHYRKIERYAELSAREKLAKGKNSSPLKLLILPFFKFISVYIFHLGILDGAAGYQIARREAYYVRRRNEWMQTLK